LREEWPEAPNGPAALITAGQYVAETQWLKVHTGAQTNRSGDPGGSLRSTRIADSSCS